MTKAQLIELILQAPEERHAAIILAAKGGDVIRPGTAREAAAVLGYECTKSVYRMVARGEIKPIRLSPRRIRFDLNACKRLAEQGIAQEAGNE